MHSIFVQYNLFHTWLYFFIFKVLINSGRTSLQRPLWQCLYNIYMCRMNKTVLCSTFVRMWKKGKWETTNVWTSWRHLKVHEFFLCTAQYGWRIALRLRIRLVIIATPIGGNQMTFCLDCWTIFATWFSQLSLQRCNNSQVTSMFTVD